jgi:hypothetical protein
MSLNFDVNSNLSLVRRFHTGKIVKMRQFYSDSSRFFATNCTTLSDPLIGIYYDSNV